VLVIDTSSLNTFIAIMDTALEPPKITWQQRIAASRFFVTSTILHVLLLVFLWGVIVTISDDQPEFVAEGGDGLLASPDDLPAAPETPPDAVPVEQFETSSPDVSSPTLDVIATAATNATAFKVAPPTVKVTIKTDQASLNGAVSNKVGQGGGNIPGSMRGRLGGNRGKAMAASKMTTAAEAAVLRGLEWLRTHQNPDGSWGEANRGAMTGFALLCFLGHGETDKSAQYGLTVTKGVDWVLQNGTKFQGRLHMDDSFKRSSDVYEHGICAYALGEYFTMTKDERVIELLRQAIGYIVQGQGPRGGWMYNFDKSADDLSVSGWQIQALKAAHLTQLNIPGVDAALEKSVECIDKVWKGPKGGYGYRGAEDRYSLTGVGVLCRLFIKGEHGDVSKGMDLIMDETEKSKPIKYKTDNADLYAWYYHTQAALMFGGASWNKWNRWFQDELVGAQNPDGSWPAPGHKNHGPMNEESMTGKVYRTTLCILMLEVFYRYMPSNQAI
jgi:hypothetical protein